MSDITFSDPPVDLTDAGAAVLPWNYLAPAFGDLTDARAAVLPWNYLAPAFGDLLSRASGQTRIMMALPQGDQPARFAVIAADILKDPKATADFILSLKVDGAPIAPRQRFFVGPATTRRPTFNADMDPEVFDVKGLAWDTAAQQVFNRAVVIIDAGIAFWNARFRGRNGPRFQGIRYRDFEADDLGQKAGLAAAMIANLCQMADTLGSPAVLDYLAGAYPKIVFGAAANPDPNGFWHGTAVADLAGGPRWARRGMSRFSGWNCRASSGRLQRRNPVGHAGDNPARSHRDDRSLPWRAPDHRDAPGLFRRAAGRNPPGGGID